MNRCLNIAAMGYSGIYPENTWLCYQKALEAGATGFEVDAQMTKDGVVVLSHDETLGRTTDGHGLIRAYDWAELQQFNAAHQYISGKSIHQLFSSRPRADEIAVPFDFCPIPRLEELIELVLPTEAELIVEMKGTPKLNPGLGDAIAQTILSYGLQARCIISYFDHQVIWTLSRKYPMIRFAAISGYETFCRVGEYIRGTGAKQFHPHAVAVNDEVIASCHAQGVEVVAWSAGETDDEACQEALLRMGVDGIMTHYPNRLARVRRDVAP